MKRRKTKASLDNCHVVIVCGIRLSQWMKKEIEYALKFQKEIIVSSPEMLKEIMEFVGESGIGEFGIKLNPEYIKQMGLNYQMESVSYFSVGVGGA